MECLYTPELQNSSEEIYINGEEFRHLRALRLREGEQIMLSSGKGMCGIAHIISYTKNEAKAIIKELLPNFGEDSLRFGLGIGILDSRERMEFALEKAVELGITDFYPIASEFSQKRTVSIDRLKGKAIAAMKQCKRSVLTMIHEPLTIEKLLGNTNEWSKIFIADVKGKSLKNNTTNEPTLVLIGAEGGFSAKETASFEKDSRTTFVSLGNRRLRAETAAIVALSLLT